MDELLEILMRDKAWSEDLARKTYIAILEIIEPPRPKVADGQIPPDDPTVATYRRRLKHVRRPELRPRENVRIAYMRTRMFFDQQTFLRDAIGVSASPARPSRQAHRCHPPGP